jgi:hypothetical protein
MADQPPPQNKAEALEQIRTKLEEVRKKKEAAEERWKQQQQAVVTSPNTNTKRDKVREALDRARSKLQGVQERALLLQQQQQKKKKKNRSPLTPISALSTELVIRGISSTGPPELVHHPFGSDDRKTLEIALGGTEAVRALHKGDTNGDDVSSSSSLSTSTSLPFKRKPNELPAPNTDSKKQKAAAIPTKEELLDRKTKAQIVVDISYWKHFLSKQKALLSKINNHTKWEDCVKERHSTNVELSNLQQELTLLDWSHEVVERGTENALKELLAARQELYETRRDHEERTRRTAKQLQTV